MEAPQATEGAFAAKRLKELKSPVFPTTRKISRLLEAVAVLDCIFMKHAYTARNDGAGWTYTLRISVSKFPLGEGGRPKAGGWIRLEEAGAAKQLRGEKSPVFPTTRKISRLIKAVAILTVSSSSMLPPLEMTGVGWPRTSGIPSSPMWLFPSNVISRPNHPSCGFGAALLQGPA